MNSTTCKERKVTSEVPSVKSYLPEILIKTVAGSKWALFVNLRESYGIRNPLALVEGLPLVDRKIRNSLYQMDTIASVSRESAQVIGSFLVYEEAYIMKPGRMYPNSHSFRNIVFKRQSVYCE